MHRKSDTRRPFPIEGPVAAGVCAALLVGALVAKKLLLRGKKSKAPEADYQGLIVPCTFQPIPTSSPPVAEPPLADVTVVVSSLYDPYCILLYNY